MGRMAVEVVAEHRTTARDCADHPARLRPDANAALRQQCRSMAPLCRRHLAHETQRRECGVQKLCHWDRPWMPASGAYAMLACPSAAYRPGSRETVRTCPQSARDPAPPGAEPGTVLDADRRHAERRLALRERTRDAEAVRELLRLVHVEQIDLSQVKRVDFEIISYLKEVASGPVPQPAPRGAQPAQRAGAVGRRRTCGGRRAPSDDCRLAAGDADEPR